MSTDENLIVPIEKLSCKERLNEKLEDPKGNLYHYSLVLCTFPICVLQFIVKKITLVLQVPDNSILPFSVAIWFVKPCSLHYGFFWILRIYCALKGREYFSTVIIIYSRSLDNGAEVILKQQVHAPLRDGLLVTALRT